MELLIDMVRSLVVVILLASFMEMLLPAGNIRPFVRFAIGLFVLIAILNPVLKLLSGSQELKMDAWVLEWKDDRTEEILREGQRLNQQLWQQTQQTVKSKVESQVTAVAGLVPGVHGLETRVDIDNQGRIRELLLVVKADTAVQEEKGHEIRVFARELLNRNQEEEAVIQAKLVNLLGNLYGLEENAIKVKFEGG